MCKGELAEVTVHQEETSSDVGGETEEPEGGRMGHAKICHFSMSCRRQSRPSRLQKSFLPPS